MVTKIFLGKQVHISECFLTIECPAIFRICIFYNLTKYYFVQFSPKNKKDLVKCLKNMAGLKSRFKKAD